MDKISFLIVAALSAMSVSGCMSIPKNSSELIATTDTTQTFCYSLSPEIVVQRLEAYLSQCYRPVSTMIPIGTAYVPMNSNFQTTHEKLPNGDRYSVRNPLGFGYSANIVGGVNGCNSEVKMYAITDLWKGTFVGADQAIKGGEIKCR